MSCRHRVLPDRGTLLVHTDVHGNLDDFRAVEAVFRGLPDAEWVILGDVVHAPNAEARQSDPALYDFPDGSLAIVLRILELQRELPGRIHFVLGNHDHGHVGGPHAAKFYPALLLVAAR